MRIMRVNERKKIKRSLVRMLTNEPPTIAESILSTENMVLFEKYRNVEKEIIEEETIAEETIAEETTKR